MRLFLFVCFSLISIFSFGQKDSIDLVICGGVYYEKPLLKITDLKTKEEYRISGSDTLFIEHKLSERSIALTDSSHLLEPILEIFSSYDGLENEYLDLTPNDRFYIVLAHKNNFSSIKIHKSDSNVEQLFSIIDELKSKLPHLPEIEIKEVSFNNDSQEVMIEGIELNDNFLSISLKNNTKDTIIFSNNIFPSGFHFRNGEYDFNNNIAFFNPLIKVDFFSGYHIISPRPHLSFLPKESVVLTYYVNPFKIEELEHEYSIILTERNCSESESDNYYDSTIDPFFSCKEYIEKRKISLDFKIKFGYVNTSLVE